MKSGCWLHLICSSVRSSVRMEQDDSHWTDFNEIWYFTLLLNNYVQQIQFSLKSDMKNCINLQQYLAEFFLV